jgi:hypothetical protein
MALPHSLFQTVSLGNLVNRGDPLLSSLRVRFSRRLTYLFFVVILEES